MCEFFVNSVKNSQTEKRVPGKNLYSIYVYFWIMKEIQKPTTTYDMTVVPIPNHNKFIKVITDNAEREYMYYQSLRGTSLVLGEWKQDQSTRCEERKSSRINYQTDLTNLGIPVYVLGQRAKF